MGSARSFGPGSALGLPAPFALAGYFPTCRKLRRMPKLLSWVPGVLMPRSAERKFAPKSSQEPPRWDRSEPDAGPVGSVSDPVG